MSIIGQMLSGDPNSEFVRGIDRPAPTGKAATKLASSPSPVADVTNPIVYKGSALSAEPEKVEYAPSKPGEEEAGVATDILTAGLSSGTPAATTALKAHEEIEFSRKPQNPQHGWQSNAQPKPSAFQPIPKPSELRRQKGPGPGF